MTVDNAVTTTATRRQELLEGNAEFLRVVETCTAEEWARVCPTEGWPVGVVALHIARGHATVRGWLETLRAGGDVTMTSQELDATNAIAAAENFSVTKARVIEVANENIALLATFLTSLTEDDLAMGGAFGPGGGDRVTVARFAGSRGHLDNHLARIRATLGR
jgi:hypothetical protein